MVTITTSEYIAARNPNGANKVFSKYAGRPATSYDELVNGLNKLGKQHGQKIANDLMEYHPDKKYLSCSGCQGNEEQCSDKAEGKKSKLQDFVDNNQKTLIIGASIVLAALILKNIK
jgi:hypothetical protein